MSSQNPSFPVGPADDPDADQDPETIEVDGKQVIGPDADQDGVDSAEADRLAAENGDDPDR